ncbi:MAG TPA: bacterial transcriptional activator domain-containing protein, partial [Gemmatimonadaceae bacterium]|nr:bacterial transcriptional activator domain-containing protein [Gemmatimonadaceae bacterium]
LRRTLGADVVPRGRGDELCVRAGALWCDAIEFERALDEDRPADALGLYRGPLLPGLHVTDASPELEEWLEAERAHLARRWTHAVERVATEREERGDASGAAVWWRQLAAHDRFSSRIALRLMRALAATGDPAEAIRHARAHEQLLREELGAAPDSRIGAFVRSLRATS